MNEEVKNITEAIQWFKKNKPNFIRLVNPANGETVNGYNLKIKDNISKLAEIEKVLKTEILPDGVYSIQHRQNLDQEPTNYYVRKGRKKAAETMPTTLKDDNNNVRTMSEALKDQIRVKELEMQVQSLTEKLAAAYEEEADDLADAPPPEPISNTIISLLKEIGLPLLEKHFEIQERKLQLMAAKATTQQTQTATPRTYQAPTINPAIVPQQNQPPTQVVYNTPPPGAPGSGGGGLEFTPAKSNEQAELIEYIQGAEVAELNSWLKQLRAEQGDEIINELLPLVNKYRKQDFFAIIEGL